ncbi:hypothetical protein TWF970_002509 [Orbilia oligospora]|uniref:Non-haem dioxygenase N-terminal domain-containing protein n=1 Tax=Orbilia oligospora TaxID=2813651 RepID=A0A7C8V8E1_ORBOL|nr:hypothetical protein TWF970_002509 [Orbilia oligospora]
MSTAEPTPATAQIPVINVSQIDIETADRLVDAAATFGFIFVELESTNIDYNSVQHMFQLSKKFFSSPRAEKEKCAISENNKGWSSMLSETLDPENQSRGDFKEALNFGEFKDGHAQQPLPDSLVADESTLNDFFTSCHNLCVRLLQLFAMGLKIDEEAGGKDWFSSRHDQSGPSGSILRLLHVCASHSFDQGRKDWRFYRKDGNQFRFIQSPWIRPVHHRFWLTSVIYCHTGPVGISGVQFTG